MFSVLSALAEHSASWRTTVSGVMGSTSLACWIVLLMPQLIEQWRMKSAEGIAIGFISIWFLGDVFNLIGALWAHLLPEVNVPETPPCKTRWSRFSRRNGPGPAFAQEIFYSHRYCA
ncbi:hypothetical protein OXX79_006774 [Metschnikowia pulcherrima]